MKDFAAARAARLRSLADGVVRLGPRTLHVDVTNACNARCLSCWDHSPLLRAPRAPEWKRQHMEPGVFARLLDDVMGLGGLEHVIVSGMGEPFVHPRIAELVAAVKERGLHLTAITNLVAARAGLAAQADELLVGIHAATPETYAAFHPGFGEREWRRLDEMLAEVTRAGRRCKHVHVVCRVNAHELVGMIGLGARHGAARVSFKLGSLGGGTESVRIDEAQRAELLAVTIAAAEAAAAREGVRHNLATLRGQLAAGGAATAAIAEAGCWLGYDYARVSVDGTALYCCSSELAVGRLTEPGDFARLWHGPRWHALRARLARGELFPACAQCGKLDQNLKLGERFRARFGDVRWVAEAAGAEAVE